MHLSHVPPYTIQNRNVHISVLNGVLWDMEQEHSGIYEIGLLFWTKLNKQIFSIKLESGMRLFSFN